MNINKPDLALMIKMENLIWQNDKKLFGKDLKKTYKSADGEPITYKDFKEYYNLIDRILIEYQEHKRKRTEYNKANPEWHKINCAIADAKRRGDAKAYIKWKATLAEYNRNKKVKDAKKVLEKYK